MNAPNREIEVHQIWNSHPPINLDGSPFTAFADDDVRRIYLLAVLLPKLQKVDSDWGYLIKGSDFIPSDIIVWHPTMEHFDVLTGNDVAWQPRGVVTNPDWRFGTLDSPAIPPIVVPPTPNIDFERMVWEQLGEIIARQHETLDQVNAIMGKLEHYDREFKAIQPELQLLVAAITGGGVNGLANAVGPILGGLFGKK